MLPWLKVLKVSDDEEREQKIAGIPDELPILPLRNTVAFPYAVIPLTVGLPRSVRLVREAQAGNGLLGLVAMQDGTVEEPKPGEVFEIGTVAQILKVAQAEDESLQVFVRGLARFKITYWVSSEPYLRAKIELSPEKIQETDELEALRRTLLDVTGRLVALLPQIPDEAAQFMNQIEDSTLLVYLIASSIRISIEDAQEVLALDDVSDKMRKLIAVLNRELKVLELGQKIQSEAQEEMQKAQREYFLREQIKAIQKELGEGDETQVQAEDYRKRIEEAGMPEEAKKEALRELGRFEKLPPQAAEYGMIKTYLDWLVEMPWNKMTQDNLDIQHARQVLDEDHYDLQEIKTRILEYLAVRKLQAERGVSRAEAAELVSPENLSGAGGAILCLVGPPGVGKTSLGRSVARALGREFTRMSLGGMRDEAEIRGHRRTYIGAMPGRIIQAIKRTGKKNPVFMLDEVDKIGQDWRGDPSSALLEVLDPAQNNTFRDYYLDVDFDLSQVIFICTANQLEPIPEPLRDRMEILHLDGYTEYEKINIADNYLVPRQVKANGLRREEIVFLEEALRAIIRDYTREAGVRNLEREIGSICRKVATRIAGGDAAVVEITPERVREFLGKPKFFFEAALRTEKPGVATGLSVTAFGGEVLFIEAAAMPGKEGLILTGQLGDVMKESARIALSYVRSHAQELALDPDFFANREVHIHVPAGAIPKDGPSAGITMTTALVSLASGIPMRADTGMTGEITLQGQVLPIGGLKQKVLAAHRAGLKTVILPKRNEADLDEVPEEVQHDMTFIPVETIDEVLARALREPLHRERELVVAAAA